jgi:hypothetical protein
MENNFDRPAGGNQPALRFDGGAMLTNPDDSRLANRHESRQAATADLPATTIDAGRGIDSAARQEFKDLPATVRKDIADLTNRGAGTSISGPETRQFLVEMANKYGSERVGQLFDTMRGMSGTGNAADFSFELRADRYETEEHAAKRHERMQNMEWMCQPGNLERMQQLVQTMRAEGYTQTFPLRSANERSVGVLSSSQQERGAHIEFENMSRTSMAPANFFHENKNMMSDQILPSDRLREFRQWEARRAGSN